MLYRSFFLALALVGCINAMDSTAHCFVCDETNTKELVYTNDFFNCDTDPCAIYCRKCLINALKRQTRSISFKSYCNQFKCPICWSTIKTERSRVLLDILQDYRRRFQDFRFDYDELFSSCIVYNDVAPINIESNPLVQEEGDILLQEALAIKHSDDPVTCQCCKILKKLRKTEGGRLKVWQYFIAKPSEAWKIVSHNARLMGKSVRDYSPQQIKILSRAILRAQQNIDNPSKENESCTEKCNKNITTSDIADKNLAAETNILTPTVAATAFQQ